MDLWQQQNGHYTVNTWLRDAPGLVWPETRPSRPAALSMKFFFDKYEFTSGGALGSLTLGLVVKELWRRRLPGLLASQVGRTLGVWGLIHVGFQPVINCWNRVPPVRADVTPTSCYPC